MSRNRWTASLLLIAALTVSCATSEPPEPAVELPSATAEGPLIESRRLSVEAEPWFRQASDPHLTAEERVAARQEALTRMVRARELMDQHIEEHPEQVESLDAEYVSAAGKLYWLRKMSGSD